MYGGNFTSKIFSSEYVQYMYMTRITTLHNNHYIK